MFFSFLVVLLFIIFNNLFYCSDLKLFYFQTSFYYYNSARLVSKQAYYTMEQQSILLSHGSGGSSMLFPCDPKDPGTWQELMELELISINAYDIVCNTTDPELRPALAAGATPEEIALQKDYDRRRLAGFQKIVKSLSLRKDTLALTRILRTQYETDPDDLQGGWDQILTKLFRAHPSIQRRLKKEFLAIKQYHGETIESFKERLDKADSKYAMSDVNRTGFDDFEKKEQFFSGVLKPQYHTWVTIHEGQAITYDELVEQAELYETRNEIPGEHFSNLGKNRFRKDRDSSQLLYSDSQNAYKKSN